MRSLLSLVIAISLILSLGLVAAEASSECNLEVTLINQDPEPAIPGDYVEVIFQLSDTENSNCQGARFAIVPTYPFSLDDPSDAEQEISGTTFVNNYQSSWNIPYKLRIDPNALEGENEIEVKYAPGKASSSFHISKRFNITVENVRVEFEVFVKDYNPSTNELTFEILNIGENDVEALTIEIPEQEGIQLKGTPRNIVGSLDSNEETTFDFTAIPEKGDITLDIFYTDEINERRSLQTTAYFNPDYFAENGKSLGMSIWFYLFIALVLILAGRWWWKRRKAKTARK